MIHAVLCFSCFVPDKIFIARTYISPSFIMMALRVVTCAALAGSVFSYPAGSGKVNLAIEDCGDTATHGRLESIHPPVMRQGKHDGGTLVRGYGHLDTTVEDGDYKVNVKALGISMQKCHAGLCRDHKANVGVRKCALPASTGHVDFRGLACPQAPGPVALDFDVYVSRVVPSSLAYLEIEIASEGSAGKLFCAKIHTSPGPEFNSQFDPFAEQDPCGKSIFYPFNSLGCPQPQCGHHDVCMMRAGWFHDPKSPYSRFNPPPREFGTCQRTDVPGEFVCCHPGQCEPNPPWTTEPPLDDIPLLDQMAAQAV